MNLELIAGPVSALVAALITWLLSRRKYAAQVTDSLALAAKREAETDRIRLEAYANSVRHLERRVDTLEREAVALRAVWDYLAERVDPAVAAEARKIYDEHVRRNHGN